MSQLGLSFTEPKR